MEPALSSTSFEIPAVFASRLVGKKCGNFKTGWWLSRFHPLNYKQVIFTANSIHLKYPFAILLKTFVSSLLNIKSNFWRTKLRYPWYIASIFNWVFESLTLIETEGVWWWCDGGLKSPSNSLRQDLLLWPGVFVSWGLFFEMGYKGDSLKWIQSVSPYCKCETVTILVFSCGLVPAVL